MKEKIYFLNEIAWRTCLNDDCHLHPHSQMLFHLLLYVNLNKKKKKKCVREWKRKFLSLHPHMQCTPLQHPHSNTCTHFYSLSLIYIIHYHYMSVPPLTACIDNLNTCEHTHTCMDVHSHQCTTNNALRVQGNTFNINF